METTLYTLEISNNIGLTKKITFLGVDTITSTPEPINVSAAYKIFPWLPPRSVERPTREVSLLIGNDKALFLPTGGELKFTDENLRCMKSSFSTGWVLGGRHSKIKSRPQSFSPAALMLRTAAVSSSPLRSLSSTRSRLSYPLAMRLTTYLFVLPQAATPA